MDNFNLKKKSNNNYIYGPALIENISQFENIYDSLYYYGYFLIPTSVSWCIKRNTVSKIFNIIDRDKSLLLLKVNYEIEKRKTITFYDPLLIAEIDEILASSESYGDYDENFLCHQWESCMSDSRFVADLLVKLSNGSLSTNNLIYSGKDYSLFSPVLKIHKYESIDKCYAKRHTKNDDNKISGSGNLIHMHEHVDPTSFSLVYADDSEYGGLEARNEKKEWLPVKAPPGTVIVFIGMGVHGETNGSIPQSFHRINGSRNDLKTRLSLVFGVHPDPKNMKVFNGTKDRDLKYKDYLDDIKPCEVIKHWELIKSILSGELQPFSNRKYWDVQIHRYCQYMYLRNYFLEKDLNFPDPPREVYYVWIVHMLQPLAYKNDCMNAFGRIIPHTNHIPDFETLDLDVLEYSYGPCIDVAYTCVTGKVYTIGNNIDVLSLFLNVEWWKAFDGVQSIFFEVMKKSTKILNHDLCFLEKCVDHYRKFIELTFLSNEVLEPGLSIDLTWHAHQCSPLSYNHMMENGLKFINHNPCGEENPADPEWTQNTIKAWGKFLTCDLDCEIFPAGEFGLCSNGEGWQRARHARGEYTQFEKAEMEALRAVEVPEKTQNNQKQLTTEYNTNSAPAKMQQTKTKEVMKNNDNTIEFNRSDILAAATPMKRFGRSKIMIIGEGRAGKTCLANSLCGIDFSENSPSTVGINEFTMDIKNTSASLESGWNIYTKPEKEYETELAKMVVKVKLYLKANRKYLQNLINLLL